MNACLIAYTNYEADFRVRRYAEILADGESRVDVISLRGANESPEGELNGVRIHRIQRRDSREKGLLNYIFNYLRFMLRGTALLMRLHNIHTYKIIHIHNVPDFLVFMAAIPKWKGAKVILDIHDIVPEFFCQKFGKSMDSLLAKSAAFRRAEIDPLRPSHNRSERYMERETDTEEPIIPRKMYDISSIIRPLEFFRHRERAESFRRPLQTGLSRELYPISMAWTS